MAWYRWWKTTAEITEEVLAAVEKKQTEVNEARNAEPWVDIKGLVEDPTHGIKVELDWNDEFVNYLRDNGINGVDDEVVVQKWITLLYRDLIEVGAENISEGVNNEFE